MTIDVSQNGYLPAVSLLQPLAERIRMSGMLPDLIRGASCVNANRGESNLEFHNS